MVWTLALSLYYPPIGGLLYLKITRRVITARHYPIGGAWWYAEQ